VTQILYLLKAPEVTFAVAPVGKLVGALQFAYLPLLLLRTFWLNGESWLIVDHVLFTILMIPTAINVWDYARMLARVLRRPSSAATA
jgi:phosphatidylglycerophosphate synthase